MKLLALYRIFFQRHRWDFLLFWAITAIAFWVFATGSEVLSREALHRLETFGLFWFMGRMSLSLGGFGTLGGWQQRPVSSKKIAFAQVTLFLIGISPFILIKSLGFSTSLNTSGLALYLVFWLAVIWLILRSYVKEWQKLPADLRARKAWMTMLLLSILAVAFS